MQLFLQFFDLFVFWLDVFTHFVGSEIQHVFRLFKIDEFLFKHADLIFLFGDDLVSFFYRFRHQLNVIVGFQHLLLQSVNFLEMLVLALFHLLHLLVHLPAVSFRKLELSTDVYNSLVKIIRRLLQPILQLINLNIVILRLLGHFFLVNQPYLI